jgi:uracil-DNA glycosylase family 4
MRSKEAFPGPWDPRILSERLLPALAQYLLEQRARGRRTFRLSPEARRVWKEILLAQREEASQARPGPFAPAPSPEEQLAALAQTVARCTKCPHLAATRTQTVFGVGNPRASLLFVGEAPGAEEDRQGEPFVGPAGQLLTKMIRAMGLSREEVYIANVLKCRPNLPPGSTGNRRPTQEEMQRCLPYLQNQIQILRPKVIVALGSVALEGLLGKPFSISRLRGRFLDFQGIPLMPTYHPSYLLHNASVQVKRQVWEDLLQVMEKLGLPISQRQREYFLPKKES